MLDIKAVACDFLKKHRAMIITSAFAFATIAANTSCGFPYYEPKEPKGLEKYKKLNK